jgi:hypothetical protein
MDRKEKTRVRVATPAAGLNQSSHTEITSPDANPQRKSRARIQYLASKLQAFRPRPLYELMRELVAGAAPLNGLMLLDPAILAALGGVLIPAAYRLIGGEP